MAFVDHHQEIVREVVQQAERTGSGLAPVQVARVVFNARAVAQLADHFEVKYGAFFEPLGLERTTHFGEMLHLRAQVQLNLLDGAIQHVWRRDKQIGGEDAKLLHGRLPFVRYGVPLFNAFDFVAPKQHPIKNIAVGREDVYRVALYTKGSALEFTLCSAVKPLN